MLRRTLSIAIITALLFTMISGCGFKDIDKRFFVVSLGIDTGSAPGMFKVTLRLAIPASKIESGKALTEVESLEASSIAEAVRLLKSHVDKELDFGHCRVILIGKTLMEDSVDETLTWLARRRDISMISYVGMAEPSAHEVLKLRPVSERYPGNALLLTFGNEGTESSYTVTEYLFDFVRRRKETGKDAFLPIVKMDPDRNSYEVNQVAFPDKKKLRLSLNSEETQLFNISARHFHKSAIAFPYLGTRIVLALTKVSTSVDISTGDIPVVTFRIRAKGYLEQSPPRFMNGNIPKIENHLQTELNRQLEELLYKIRDAGVDPYGFGLHYLAQYFGNSKDFEKWTKAYPYVSFRIRSRIQVDKSGQIQ
ncbi:Ger(x)C family spore germination protein [Cohnella terricola]|uniref:Ger(X)C family spore germination protein n=1 Tax=Cohnella terricola TaxID=1289167 RepID=A0A559JBQ6_9BACL|nr:Ger(x)C family spore germination protein [Cohnella terricola]TVX97312.1 Ger(x)C family spore germination protein [Cohnella terricola]